MSNERQDFHVNANNQALVTLLGKMFANESASCVALQFVNQYMGLCSKGDSRDDSHRSDPVEAALSGLIEGFHHEFYARVQAIQALTESISERRVDWRWQDMDARPSAD